MLDFRTRPIFYKFDVCYDYINYISVCYKNWRGAYKGIDAESKSCIYKVVFEKSDDTTFLVITGPQINSYGDSKLKSADGAQQALLKALYRSIPEQQNKICSLYENVINECEKSYSKKNEITNINISQKEKKLILF